MMTCPQKTGPKITSNVTFGDGGLAMIKSRFTKTEIVYAVKQVEAGVPVREVGRKYGVTEKTIYTWRNKYGGLSVSGLVCLGSTVVACFLLVTLAMGVENRTGSGGSENLSADFR